MVVHAGNASTWEMEVGGSELDHRLWLLRGLEANGDYTGSHLNKTKQGEEKAQQTRALAANPYYLSQIPGIYTLERKSQQSKAVLRCRMVT